MVGAQNTHIPLKLAMAGDNASYFCIIIYDISSNDFTNIYKRHTNETGFLAGLYKFFNCYISLKCEIGYSIANALVYLLLIGRIYIFLHICNI